MSHVERVWKEIIQSERPSVTRGILWLASMLYGAVMQARNWAYENGWLSSSRPPHGLIISVGNLVAGGTGKTPLVLKLAQELSGAAPTAILSRGYKSQAEKNNKPLLLSPSELPPPEVCGDEPRMLARRLPNLMFVIGRNRREAAQMAVDAGAKLLLLDDALQHRSLTRDLDVVVVSADDPFGGGFLLPRGMLRECPAGLGRADLVVVNGVRDQAQFSEVSAKIARFSSAPVVGMRTQVTAVTPPLQGGKVGIFCGIARPERFRSTVRELGVEVVGTLFSPDHQLPAQSVLEAFAKECASKGAQCLLCTEKDRAKFTDDLLLALPISCVEIGLEVVAGADHWRAFVDNIKGRLSESAPRI